MTRVVLTIIIVATVASSSTHAYLKLGTVVNGHVVDTTWAAAGPIRVLRVRS